MIMLADDVGYSDIGCFGSEIPTPHLDRVSREGVQYTDFHVSPLCSPTRAALLTGKNAHAAGVGMVSNIDPGFPGYASELPDHQSTLAEMLRENGYATMMVGKWHLTKDTDLSEAGDRRSWPLQRGFDQYYGFLEALTNFHHPHRLVEGNSVVDVDEYPEDYYLTDDLTDRAIRMIRESKAARPDKPFFMYYAHGAVHAPLHAKREDLLRHRGKYEAGWDRIREERLARQEELGVMPPGTQLPPRNYEDEQDVRAWDELSEREQLLFARYMEIYAAMVESIDESTGRLRQTLEEMGEWDNTIFLFLSDNGASREGHDAGTTAYFRTSQTDGAGRDEDWLAYEQDLIGGPRTWPHYPRGWAMACNTPFRLYKISTHRGGHQIPMVMSWPKGLKRPAGSSVRSQYTHVTGVVPTILELVGVQAPTHRHGLVSAPLDGVSFVPTIRDAAAEGTHGDQFYECNGNRAYRRGKWEAVTNREPVGPFRSRPERTGLKPLSEDKWELYDTENDPTQCVDVADQFPDVVEELKAAWDEAAWRNQVFPMNEGTGLAHLRRPADVESLSLPVTIATGTPTLERYRSSYLIDQRSFIVEVSFQLAESDQGVLFAHGGQEGGYLVYVEDGKLHFVQNAFGRMLRLPAVDIAAGEHQLEVDVHNSGNGRWDVTLRLDGEAKAQSDEFPAFAGWLPFQGVDVGVNRRSPVSWELFEKHGSFPFTGTMHKARWVPGEEVPNAREKRIAKAIEMGLALE
ncbi:hypothetical protein A6035_13765 [Dietzia lutea]|uniref:Sulfatase N-terminal domain-containing protein n=1 Tax=Dietzia lutea TaxID=546160 RepID=A0A2S1R9U0_9ACTN|nr:hypothetical protein A6035_13765 [Dietzia lutea]